jgi:hypothetical protein
MVPASLEDYMPLDKLGLDAFYEPDN